MLEGGADPNAATVAIDAATGDQFALTPLMQAALHAQPTSTRYVTTSVAERAQIRTWLLARLIAMGN